jgi:Domain of unknown function (DUF4160)
VPTIAWFYGIAIRMYVRDHSPPHFHAIYGEHEALVAIETGEVIEGTLPKAAARLVKERSAGAAGPIARKLASCPYGRATGEDRRPRC